VVRAARVYEHCMSERQQLDGLRACLRDPIGDARVDAVAASLLGECGAVDEEWMWLGASVPRRHAMRGSACRPSRQGVDDLLLFRESALALLREDQPSVGPHVELALRARRDGGLDAVAAQRGRETRGPSVVAASGGAVEDLDGHVHERIVAGPRQTVLNCSNGCRQLSQ
jgi:hypothetical protein